jgi:hypothetical protein
MIYVELKENNRRGDRVYTDFVAYKVSEHLGVQECKVSHGESPQH